MGEFMKNGLICKKHQEMTGQSFNQLVIPQGASMTGDYLNQEGSVKNQRGSVKKVPLWSMKLVDIQFKRVAVDIFGPVATLSEDLLDIYSRVGITEEVGLQKCFFRINLSGHQEWQKKYF